MTKGFLDKFVTGIFVGETEKKQNFLKEHGITDIDSDFDIDIDDYYGQEGGKDDKKNKEDGFFSKLMKKKDDKKDDKKDGKKDKKGFLSIFKKKDKAAEGEEENKCCECKKKKGFFAGLFGSDDDDEEKKKKILMKNSGPHIPLKGMSAPVMKRVFIIAFIFFMAIYFASVTFRSKRMVNKSLAIGSEKANPDPDFDKDVEGNERWKRIMKLIVIFTMLVLTYFIAIMLTIFLLITLAISLFNKNKAVKPYVIAFTYFKNFFWSFNAGGLPYSMMYIYIFLVIILVVSLIFFMMYHLFVKSYIDGLWYPKYVDLNRKNARPEFNNTTKYALFYGIHLLILFTFLLILIVLYFEGYNLTKWLPICIFYIITMLMFILLIYKYTLERIAFKIVILFFVFFLWTILYSFVLLNDLTIEIPPVFDKIISKTIEASEKVADKTKQIAEKSLEVTKKVASVAIDKITPTPVTEVKRPTNAVLKDTGKAATKPVEIKPPAPSGPSGLTTSKFPVPSGPTTSKPSVATSKPPATSSSSTLGETAKSVLAAAPKVIETAAKASASTAYLVSSQ